jgi:hypothetical protein
VPAATYAGAIPVGAWAVAGRNWTRWRPARSDDEAVEIVRLGAWCDFVTEDEMLDRLAAEPDVDSEPRSEGSRGRVEGFVPATLAHLSPELVDEVVRNFRRGASFRVSEFAVLADGRRITLHDDRGFSCRASSGDTWVNLTLESLEADVRTTVLPDDDDSDEDHPWEWLAELLAAHGIVVPPDQLELVPYVVEFSDRLRTRLDTTR